MQCLVPDQPFLFNGRTDSNVLLKWPARSYCFCFPGIWIFLTLLPTLILNTEEKDTPLCAQDFTGWVIWTLGFVLEAVADHQKWKFKSNVKNAVSAFVLYFQWGLCEIVYKSKIACM